MSSCLCISIEIFCFFGVIIFDAVFNEYVNLTENGVRPFKRGFFCDDESIMKPYGQESLSFTGILSAGIILSLAMIMALEVGNHYTKSKSNGGKTEDDGTKVGPVVVPIYIIRMLHRMAMFGFGMAILLPLTDIIKVLTGRLRPHFLAVCKPNATLFNCSTGYITADVCTGDPLKIKNARMSFPSGHTSCSAYCLVFIAICLQAVVCLRKYKLLRTLFQSILLLLGLAVGLSRIRDYYHHWTDVLGGFIFGAFAAWFVATKVIHLFDHEDDKPESFYTILSNEDEEVKLGVTKQEME
ncbi:phospholipid phosphatase 1-like [Actinia tenebrosa]|uniref:Phospholipid phosphatase 1-like n=1 Tax=Actinia tenebrosa TaxID=6105 RepID=A0A6P8J4N9_ACTTE|nr:phospholipid phosphatase 1-like [Actinia tenebrosa]